MKIQTLLSPAGKTTAVYFLAFITLGMTTASLGPTLDALAAQTSARLDQISWLFAVRSLGYMLGSLAAGRLIDRRPGHPIMAAALLVMALGVGLVPGLTLFTVLLLMLMIVGFGEGLVDVGGNTLIVWLHGRKVGPFMNALHFCYGLGALLAPIIVAQVVLYTGGIAWAYTLIALGMLPTLLGLLFNRSPANPADGQEGGQAGARGPVPGQILLFILFFILYVGAEVAYGGWIYLYGIRAANMPPTTAAYLTSAFWGAFTFSRLLSIPIGARLKARTILLIDLCGALTSLAVLFIWPEQVWALWVTSVGFGLSLASMFPTMMTFAGRRIQITARVTGYFFLGATLGSMFLPWLIGQFFESVGPAFFVRAVIIDVLLICLILLVINAALKKPALQSASSPV